MGKGYTFLDIYKGYLYYILTYAILGVVLTFVYLFSSVFDQIANYLWILDLLTYGIAIAIFIYALAVRASAIFFIFPLYYICLYSWLLISAYYQLMPADLSSGFVLGFMFFTSFFELLFSAYLLKMITVEKASIDASQANNTQMQRARKKRNKPRA